MLEWWARLAELRKSAGYTQREAAEALGVTPRTIRRLEQGLYPIKLPMFMNLLELYDVPWGEAFQPGSRVEKAVSRAVELKARHLKRHIDNRLDGMTVDGLRAMAFLLELLQDVPRLSERTTRAPDEPDE